VRSYVCPICKKRLSYEPGEIPPHFPFCSKRCKLIDLGHWLDGDYTIPGANEEDTNGRSPSRNAGHPVGENDKE